MSLFDRLVVATLPCVPRAVVGKVAAQYIAGETLAEAVQTVQGLNGRNLLATVDVLGEFVHEAEKAKASAEAYVRLLDAISANRLSANVSVKLTAMGLSISPEFCRENFHKVLAAAAERGTFVRIDMEDSPYTTATLQIYDEFRTRHNIGVVIQAYMRRSEDDVKDLMRRGPANFRVCKGIYNEPESIAYKGRQEVRDNFVRLLELTLDGGAYVGIATHDEWVLDHAEGLIKRRELAKDRYEFQMLLGVRHTLRDRLLAAGHRVRVYVPFGEAWYGYCTRRLKENPRIAGYVFKALFE